MSLDFFLQPLDGGPQITDKRVSRRHAILEVVGSQLRIKPIHTNPCFRQSSEESQLSPMKTHVWCWLNPGDSFSLLLNKYSFRVFSPQAEVEMECTLRNSQILDEDDVLSEMQKSPVINLPDETAGASRLQGSPKLTECAAVKTLSSSGAHGDGSGHQPHPAQRKRILPAWMLAESLSDQNLSAPVLGGDKDVAQSSGKEGTCKDKAPVNRTWHGRKRLISLGNSESMSAEQDPGKKCKSSDQEGPVVSSKKVPESLSSIALGDPDTDTVKISEPNNAGPIEELGEVSRHKTVSQVSADEEREIVSRPEGHSSVQKKSPPGTSQGFDPESSSAPSSPDASHTMADSVLGCSGGSKVWRASCMYGAKCYRKNPLHFQHFSHPGDSDYGDVQVTDEGVTGQRPECPYGAACYRKNPQHKMEYRHSALPVRVALDEDSDDVGQPSEKDLNDSFATDDDQDEEDEYEPIDEDSDWQPGEDDEEKEDVEELLKEAKRFMKRKK
ncbi:aprataxin and PNK-like factor isoform X2 [Onychomys torridus]|uniref:aprataxin and PNK-like factor isoform X2 n=1 Tax=Onychomys torridus TaxID=38674 RepID=UPI00167F6C97|nr:aprataxin and PNK-like factor isoform X2 [Onychomys torridus]